MVTQGMMAMFTCKCTYFLDSQQLGARLDRLAGR